jgi:pimeloyl-ACP methyl ester carboxylesterase
MTANHFSHATKILLLALAYLVSGSLAQAQVFPFPIPSPSEALNQTIAAWMQTNTVALNAGGKVVNTAKYGPIEYSKNGTGPVVLCMHGGPGGYDQSALIGEHLIAQGFTVIGVSRPGYLRTPLLPGTNDTIKLQAGAMMALLDELGIKQAASLGFSAGSIVAFQMALDYPDRIFACNPAIPIFINLH